jgi:transcriptional regulator with XRE-family HTH domain
MSDWHTLGLKLKEVREYLNLSQQYVSDRTGIPRSAVSDIERGGRKVDSLELKKLAGLYRKPVGYFLDEDDASAGGEHAIAALMRNLTAMTDENRKAIEAFAEFLVHNKTSDQEPS